MQNISSFQSQAWRGVVPGGRDDSGGQQNPDQREWGREEPVLCDFGTQWCRRDRRWTLQSESQEQVWRGLR